MNYPNRMAVRCWNYTFAALILFAALYFAGRICVAIASGRVQQITHAAPVRPGQQSANADLPADDPSVADQTVATCRKDENGRLRDCKLNDGHTLDEVVEAASAEQEIERQELAEYQRERADLEEQLKTAQSAAKCPEVVHPEFDRSRPARDLIAAVR